MSYAVLNLCETSLLKDICFLTKHNLEKPVRWLHVAELSQDLDDLDDQLKSGDMLIIMGPFLQNDPSTLMQVIDIAADNDLACILLYQNALEDGIPETVLSFADRKRVTLATTGTENIRITDLTSTVTQNIREFNYALPSFLPFHLLKDIIHGDFYSDESLFLMRAQSIGFDLTVPHQGIWIRVVPKLTTPVEVSGRIHNRQWMECADSVLSHYFKHPYLKGNSEPDSYFLIPKTYVSIDTIGAQIMKALKSTDENNQFEIRVGIGTMYPEVHNFHTTMKEAQQVVEILELLNRSGEYCFAGDIMLSLLVREERDNPMFYKLYANNIQPLLEMDISEKNDLIRTLEPYLECGSNISQAADALYVHRNTMRARLENISALTRRDLKDPLDCLELQLALHYYKVNIKTAAMD